MSIGKLTFDSKMSKAMINTYFSKTTSICKRRFIRKY